ncbi:MAG: hypothetical protein ACJARD_000194, partial [Alphaproteobacteria bacterium]
LSALIIDNKIIDGIMCGLPAAFVRASGHLSGKYHNGYLYYYALAMISGVVLLLICVIIGGL